MSEKDIIARIERLEKLALLSHGTLDVDEVEARLKALSETSKVIQKVIDAEREENRKELDKLTSQHSEEVRKRRSKSKWL